MICCLLQTFICLLVLGGIGFALFYFLAPDEQVDKVKDMLPDDIAAQLFREEDPFAGLNYTDTWPNNGNGLDLIIVNSLSDESWFPYFDLAVSQWDAGTPDSLTLTTEVRTPTDTECSPLMGYMKVCNGDYGATNWKGVNQILSDDNGNIMASTALMNEYYLDPVNGNSDEKQYTMCHEIGHGFGLAHTDEAFYNRDQGNCMDYTMRPGKNKQPDDVNFQVLAKLYGGGGETTTDGASAAGTTAAESALAADGDDGTRRLRNSLRNSNSDENQLRRRKASGVGGAGTTPEWIRQASNEIHRTFLMKADATKPSSSSHGGVLRRELLHKTPFGEAHMFDIGNGYNIKVHLLSSSQ